MLTADSGMTLAGFGATAGFFALFFFGEIPIVRKDILSVRSQRLDDMATVSRESRG